MRILLSKCEITRYAALAMSVWMAAAAWAADKPPVAHQREPAPKATARPAASDVQIETAFRARLAKSKIGADKFQVHVQGGVATLEGRTDVVQHKGAATRMAKAAGAVAVNNRIQISDAAKQKSAANLESGRRRAQVKRGDPRTETAKK